MVNPDDTIIFVDSLLKVKASENLNVEEDLQKENTNNKTISELLEDNDQKE